VICRIVCPTTRPLGIGIVVRLGVRTSSDICIYKIINAVGIEPVSRHCFTDLLFLILNKELNVEIGRRSRQLAAARSEREPVMFSKNIPDRRISGRRRFGCKEFNRRRRKTIGVNIGGHDPCIICLPITRGG